MDTETASCIHHGRVKLAYERYEMTAFEHAYSTYRYRRAAAEDLSRNTIAYWT